MWVIFLNPQDLNFQFNFLLCVSCCIWFQSMLFGMYSESVCIIQQENKEKWIKCCTGMIYVEFHIPEIIHSTTRIKTSLASEFFLPEWTGEASIKCYFSIVCSVLFSLISKGQYMQPVFISWYYLKPNFW